MIKSKLLEEGCYWFSFKMNVPTASHMGGVCDLQVRSVHSVLSSLLQDNRSQLDDESLRTLMREAEAIVNSRPLTVNQLADPDSTSNLTPNHLLTMKSKVVFAPPGVFQLTDMYCRKHWRRVQHLANDFWTRWRNEFLLRLQKRTKWTSPRGNLSLDDIIAIKDENEACGSLHVYQLSIQVLMVKCTRCKWLSQMVAWTTLVGGSLLSGIWKAQSRNWCS